MALDAKDRQRVCEFRVGRAGSGKTHSCLEEMAAELMRAPRGPLLLLIAPEQATAQLERRLTTWPGVAGGFTRARVAALSRLATLALEDAGEPPSEQLTETGRVMLIGRVLRRLNGERRLRVFGPAAELPALAERIGGALLEMERYGWRPESIEGWLADQPAGALQQTPARKLQDLLSIWRGFEEEMREGGWATLDQRHGSARGALRAWPALKGCRVWIDGFSSFTVKELELFDGVLARAESATIALLADPDQLVRQSTRARTGPERLFDNTEATYRELEGRVVAAGWTARLRAMPTPGQPTRFSLAPALGHLERNVLGRLRPLKYGGEAGEAIELIEAEARRAEVEAAARRIVALCRTDGEEESPQLMWREVGVLARDLAPYDRLVREVFGAFGIPFFIDRPRSGAGHPLARLLLSAIELLREDWAGEPAIHHLKSGLAGLRDLDLIARLENLILASDPERKGWMDELANEPTLAEAWRLAAAPLEGLSRALRKGTNPAAALREFLNALGVADVLTEWIEAAREAGNEETADLHERIWGLAGEWINDAEMVWAKGKEELQLPGDWRPFLDDLAAMIESALSAARAKLIPPTLNQVTVRQVDRSRTSDIDTLFVLGLNEGEFPRQWNSDPIIGDAEREALGGKLGPDAAAMRIQETYFGYIALTRASRRLVLLRPLVGDEGKAADPSPFFTLVAEEFPNAPRRVVGTVAEGDDARFGLRPEEWERRLSAAARAAETSAGAGELAALMTAGDPLNQTEFPVKRRAMALAGRRAGWIERGPLRVSEEAVAAALGERARLSVTALEGWFHCPFSFYANRLLKLQEREEARLTPRELGMARHAVLEALFRELKNEAGLAWGGIDSAAAERVIDATVAQIQADPEHGAKWRRGALHGLELARLGSDMKLAVHALRHAASVGRFRQRDAEWEFGRGEEPEVALAGGKLALTGKIDRIDISEAAGGGPPVLLLFDYKSGRRKFRKERTEAGIELQLAVYALAAQEGFRRGSASDARVGGLLYWPLALPAVAAASGDGDDPLVGAEWFSKNRPAGVFDEEIADLLDGGVVPDSKSAVYGFRRNKDGKLGKVGMQVARADFAFMLDTVRWALEFGAQGILSGFMDAQPYADKLERPCTFCVFASVCRRVEGTCERKIEEGGKLAFRGFPQGPGA